MLAEDIGRLSVAPRGLELRRPPRGPQPALDLVAELGYGDPVLGQAVAVSERHGLVLERLVVDRDRPGRPDLVLTAVATTDRPALVVLELLPRVLGVLAEIEVAAVGDPRELRLAYREEVLDVAGRARVVTELVLIVRSEPQMVRPDPEVRVPIHALGPPMLKPPSRLTRGNEVLHLHLFEFPCPEDEVARRDLVAEALADLRNAEGRLLAGELEVVLEVEEDALGGLRAQIHGRSLLLDRPDRGLEHEVELARLGQVAFRRLAWVLRRLAPALELIEVVGAEAQLARAAVDERIG